jgi:25S rRNA (adenine2142-N1)-methyltransferase
MYGAKSSKFVCADWVVPLLKANEKNIKSNQKGRLRILDVGAIDNQYFQYENWLQAVPIDLHGGQHESVLQVDFFDYAHSYCSGTDLYETKKKDNTATANKSPEPFDAIVMSLVLNFQGDPRKRGDMLALACDPRLLKADRSGMLFIALPSASLDNSRYCDLERFVEVCTNPLFGLELVEQKHSAKLILLAFRKTNFDTSSHAA